jgi:hypothetical protein
MGFGTSTGRVPYHRKYAQISECLYVIPDNGHYQG